MKGFLLIGLAAAVPLFAGPLTEEAAAKRIYAHLLIHDPASAVEEAKKAVIFFPESKEVRSAFLRALCENGNEVEALDEWQKIISRFKEEETNRTLLEVLAWGVLNKGDQSAQIVIRMNSLLGASFTRDARAIPILIEQLRGSNALLRSAAVHLAAMFGDAPLQAELSRMLKEEKMWYVRQEVIRAVGQLRMTELRPNLKEIIGNPKTLAEEKAAAIVSLVNMYESVELEELRSLAKSDRAGLRQLACEIVSHLDFKAGLDEIIPLLKDTSQDVRVAALTALGLLRVEKYKGKSVLDLIQKNLADSAPEAAITAAWVALLIDQKAGEKALKKWLNDPLPEWKRLASAALIAGGAAGVDLSVKILKKTDDPYIQVNLAMGLIGQRKHTKLACEKIFAVLSEPAQSLWMWDAQMNPLFRTLAPSRLSHIDQIPHYPNMIDQMVRLDLLSVLSVMRFPKAQEAVKGFLQNQTWGVTSAAAATLLEEGDEEALELVRGLLNDPEEKIRVQAALILAVIGSDVSAVKVLQDAYFNLDREMKVHILEAIAHIGDPQSIPFLIDILKEPFQVLRVVAASALIQCLYH